MTDAETSVPLVGAAVLGDKFEDGEAVDTNGRGVVALKQIYHFGEVDSISVSMPGYEPATNIQFTMIKMTNILDVKLSPLPAI